MPRRSLFIALIATCGCYSVSLHSVRHTFDTDDRLSVICQTVPSDADLSDSMEGLYKQGWRLMGVGTATTSFLFFASSKNVLCYERVNESTVATVPVDASRPSTPKAAAAKSKAVPVPVTRAPEMKPPPAKTAPPPDAPAPRQVPPRRPVNAATESDPQDQ